MYPGALKEWPSVLKVTTGAEITVKPMTDYFAPLMKWLKDQNKGRKYTLPESI